MKKVFLAAALAMVSVTSMAASLGYDSVYAKAGTINADGADPTAITIGLSKELAHNFYGIAEYTNVDFDSLKGLDKSDSYQLGLGYHTRIHQNIDLYTQAGIFNETIDELKYDEDLGFARVGLKIIAAEHLNFDVSYGSTFGSDYAEKKDLTAKMEYFVSNEFAFGVEYSHQEYLTDYGLFHADGSDDATGKVSFVASYNF